MNQIEQAIIHWIKTFVEVPHPMWGDMPPCPYARTARIENNDMVINVQPDGSDYYAFIEQCIHGFKDDDIDVALIVAQRASEVDPDEYTKYIELRNTQLISSSLYLLTDHPEIKEMNNGVCVQQGEYVITFLQRIDRLSKATERLHDTKYYDSWSPEMYDDVVVQRHKVWNKYHDGPTPSDKPFKKPDWMK